MPDLRRRSPEPPAGMPIVEHKPGLANETLRELAPLLAEEGIDVDNLDAPDVETLQRALNRAVERRNTELFTPVGATRETAAGTLRLIVEAILDGDTSLAGALLDQVVPESPDNSAATVSSCIGIALGLVDDWLSGQARDAPAALSHHTSLPAGHWTGERAATDTLVLARKGRAFHSLASCSPARAARKSSPAQRSLSSAATQAWARHSSTPRTELIKTVIR